MPTLTPEQLGIDAVPENDQVYVDRLRKFLQDTAELNILEQVIESTDLELYNALQDALDEINNEIGIRTNFTNFSDIPWNILKIGATLQILTMKGILSARNTLTYNDAGGVTVQNYDKYGRYINYYNLLLNKYMRSVGNFKLDINLIGCWGGLHSDYSTNLGPY